MARVALAEVVADVIEGEQLAAGDVDVSFETDIPASLILRADPEQLFRVLSNLIRNARQAIGAKGQPGQVHVTCTETEREWILSVADTGPGLPAMARDHLFTPFQGGIRKGGTGRGWPSRSSWCAATADIWTFAKPGRRHGFRDKSTQIKCVI